MKERTPESARNANNKTMNRFIDVLSIRFFFSLANDGFGAMQAIPVDEGRSHPTPPISGDGLILRQTVFRDMGEWTQFGRVFLVDPSAMLLGPRVFDHQRWSAKRTE